MNQNKMDKATKLQNTVARKQIKRLHRYDNSHGYTFFHADKIGSKAAAYVMREAN